MGKLDGKVAIVVGTAPRGMAAAAGRLMAKEGAKVVLADRTIESAEQVAGEIRAAGGDAFAVRNGYRERGGRRGNDGGCG